MKLKDLNNDQTLELKQNLMCKLADEGKFAEVFNEDYDYPTSMDLAFPDHLVSDEMLMEYYDGVEFTEDDFYCNRDWF